MGVCEGVRGASGNALRAKILPARMAVWPQATSMRAPRALGVSWALQSQRSQATIHHDMTRTGQHPRSGLACRHRTLHFTDLTAVEAASEDSAHGPQMNQTPGRHPGVRTPRERRDSIQTGGCWSRRAEMPVRAFVGQYHTELEAVATNRRSRKHITTGVVSPM
jgi:hypothetical protein